MISTIICAKHIETQQESHDENNKLRFPPHIQSNYIVQLNKSKSNFILPTAKGKRKRNDNKTHLPPRQKRILHEFACFDKNSPVTHDLDKSDSGNLPSKKCYDSCRGWTFLLLMRVECVVSKVANGKNGLF